MLWKPFLTPVQSMEPEEARAVIEDNEEGTYTILDVRQPNEYTSDRIPGATLIPLPELSDRLKELDPEKKTIVY